MRKFSKTSSILLATAMVLPLIFSPFSVAASAVSTETVNMNVYDTGNDIYGVVTSHKTVKDKNDKEAIEVKMMVNGEKKTYLTVEGYEGAPIADDGFYRLKLSGDKLGDKTYEFANLKMIEAGVREITAIDTNENMLTVTDTVNSVYKYGDTANVYLATFDAENKFDKWVKASESVMTTGARALALDMYDEDDFDTKSPVVDTIFVFKEADFNKLGIVYDTPAYRTDPATQVASIAVTSKVVYPHDQSSSTVLYPEDFKGVDVNTLLGSSGVSVTKQEVIYSTVKDHEGNDLQLHMQVAIPDNPKPCPAVLFIFGGGFTRAPYELNSSLTWLAEQGYVVATAEYGYIPFGTAHNAIEDTKSAVRYLRAHADEFNINPQKIGMWGQSAGGYLTAMTTAANGVKEFEKGDNLDQSSDIACAVDQYGLSDLTRVGMDYPTGSLALHYFTECSDGMFVNGAFSGKSVWDNWQEVEKVNPLTYVDKKDVPFLFFHGNADTRVAPSSTLYLHNALLKAGVESTRYVVEGGGHGGPEYSQLPIMTKVLNFFDKHLKNN